MAGFNSCVIFSLYLWRAHLVRYLFLPHNATKSLLNYVNILQHLNKEKGAVIHYVKYVVRSMASFLYYAKYKESNKAKFVLASKRLIQKLDLDNSCEKLCAATFFLTLLEYSQSIEICDTFLKFPPRYKIDSSYLEDNEDIVRKQLFEWKTTEEIENIMKEILPMFYSSKLKSLPGSYDTTQQNHVWIFRILTYIFFHDLYIAVAFITAEKWVVPDSILYELLSLPQNADDEVFPFSVHQYTMTALQEFREKSFFEEETSDQRSILLVEIMNVIGYSKREQEIHRRCEHLRTVLINLLQHNGKHTITTAGSTAEGMCGGFYSNQWHGDYDMLCRNRKIKLYTPRANNINNTPCLPFDDNEDYDASYFVEEDENFPGYVKLSFMEVNCTNMNDGNVYLANSVKVTLSNMTKSAKTSISNDFGKFLDEYQEREINGPALAIHHKTCTGIDNSLDSVACIQWDTWPDSANSFITRLKPNKWPSNNLLKNIQSQRCDVVPVGHHDSKNNDIQWRISFPGEHNLLLDLTDVQILCYVLIKIILKENLNTSQREVVSSFHIKNVMFWCVELCSCQWVNSNYINCLNICLTKLIEMIKARHIPHYIIVNRNLFNSKMTEQMSKEIVDVLSKCDVTRIFRLGAFECVLMITPYNNALLKRVTLTSTLMAGFNSCFLSFSSFVKRPSLFWVSYLPHNATESLLKYENILQHLNKEKGATIRYATYVVSSMVGFLYYAKYKESNKTKCLLLSKRLIKKSLDLDNSCVTLRAATFFLTHMEYSQSIEICDTFLKFPPRYKIDSSYSEYNDDIEMKVSQQLFEGKTTEEIEKIMKKIIQMFYSSVKLKPLPGNYDIIQQNPAWIFRNLTNIYVHGLYMDVTFMTAEKWVVPDPILYELLSLPQNTEYGVYTLPGIYLDPMFVCLQTKLLCFHSIGNTNGMTEILTLMNSFITDNTFSNQSSCVYLNMFAYCQIKAGQHRQSVKSILKSLLIFPSRYNAASGYLKIVLQVLNYLAI